MRTVFKERAWSGAAVVVVGLVAAATAQAAAKKTEAEMRQQLSGLRALSTLTDPALKPWHLKASYSLYDGQGKPSEQGTLEEWWAGPTEWRMQVASPAYSTVITTDGAHTYRTKGTPPLPVRLTLLLRQFTDPAVSQAQIDRSQPQEESKTFGKVTLDCVMVAPSSAKNPPFSLYPTYCFDPGTSMLRVSGNYGTQIVVRNKGGRFQGKEVALEVAIRENGLLSVTGAVETLTGFVPKADEFAPTTAQEEGVGGGPEKVQAGVMTGMLLQKIAPVYPAMARQNHVSGTVVLRATIGQDGRVYELDPISSPDELLTTAAVAAVRQWVYKPYLLNGQPVDIETTITVHFNIGPASSFP